MWGRFLSGRLHRREVALLTREVELLTQRLAANTHVMRLAQEMITRQEQQIAAQAAIIAGLQRPEPPVPPADSATPRVIVIPRSTGGH